LKTKLILIEGLPSTGKSTTAKITKEILDELGLDNELFLEGNLDHPADYDRVAYLTETEYKKLIKNNKSYEDFIKRITEKKEEGYFIAYHKKLKKWENEFPEDLFKQIVKNDIYEIPLELNKELILNNWKRFVKNAKEQEKIYIFECVFVQNPITVSIIRDNTDREVAFEYVYELLEIIKKLNPVLIYLNQDNIEKSFNKVIEERPEWWLDFFIEYYTNRAFGKSRNLEGLAGTLAGMKEIGDIQSDLIKKLDMDKYTLNNSHYNKKKSKNNLKNILKEVL